MKTSTLAGLMAILPAAVAAPAWIPYVYNESLPEIHGKPINANSGSFWINKPAAAVCPGYDPNCPSQNTTIISGPVYGNGAIYNTTAYWFMGILEEGGQTISTPGWDSGNGGLELEYSAAHSNGYFSGARQYHGGLSLDNSTSTLQTVGKPLLVADKVAGTLYGPLVWSACPDGNGTYLIRSGPASNEAPSDPSCSIIKITLEETTMAAPQYYFCDGCEKRCNDIYNACTSPTCAVPYCSNTGGLHSLS